MGRIAEHDADRAPLAEIAGEVTEIVETEDLGERLSRLLSLTSTKANIRERLSSYDNPASILPTEIVSEIFVHVLPAYPICPPLAGKSSPTQLTHVCRQWREIALSTPSLWRAISVSIRCDKSWSLDLVQTWLRRSGSCALSFHIKNSYGHEYSGWSVKGVLRVIIPHRARWQYLSLCLGNSCDIMLEIIGPMPLLREMKLDAFCHNWNDYPSSTSLPTGFCEAPHLRSMTYVEHTFPLIGFPWSQLTSLSLVRIEVDDCSKLLQQTVNLVQCKMWPSIRNVYTTEPDLRLPRLESLKMVQDCYYGSELMEYLGAFIVPALLHLQVPDCELDPDDFFQLLSAFIAKAGCKLQELRITGPSYYPSRRVARCRRKLGYIPRVFYNQIFLDEECETTSDEDDEDFDWDETSDED